MGLLNSCFRTCTVHQLIPEPPITTKNILSSYKKENDLISGKFGKVYRYSNRKTSENVCIKFIEREEIFKREIFALSKLNHQNIISVIDFSFIKKKLEYFIIEEYASNGDLFTLVSKNTIGEDLAKYIVNSILSGLLYAYNIHSISHGDIKPENILIMKDGTIKIADWGLSRFNTKNIKCDSFSGTKTYMAPEVIFRQSYDASKSDVWSLGVVLFLLCADTKPYSDCETFQDLLKCRYYKTLIRKRWSYWWGLHNKNILVSRFSRDLSILIQNVLDSDTDTRYSLNRMSKDKWFNNINCDNNSVLDLINMSDNNIVNKK